MLPLETTASIVDSRLVIQDAALPAHAERARVILLWESTKPVGRRSPPPALAEMGEEKGNILSTLPGKRLERIVLMLIFLICANSIRTWLL